MMRWDVINSIIKKYQFKTYLEIGVQNVNSNFNKIIAPDKTSVDPAPTGDCDYIMTSDEFFDGVRRYQFGRKWQFIFIDGLHHCHQVINDIKNSLEHLTDDGIIMCHDCTPYTEHMQLVPDHGKEWTGDVWKAIVHYRCLNPNVIIKTIDTDYGCGIIKRGSQRVYNNGIIPPVLDWKYYTEHRNEMLNVVPVSEIENI